MYFDKVEFQLLHNKTLTELGLPESPCANCSGGPVGRCTKGFKIGAPNACQKWDRWYYDIWPLVTDKLRKAAGE